MISMPCVLQTVLLNVYCYRSYQDMSSFENKDIRENTISQIDTATHGVYNTRIDRDVVVYFHLRLTSRCRHLPLVKT